MGRRISSVVLLQRKLKALRQKTSKQAMKPPFICPKCFEKTLFIEKHKGKLLVQVYCTKCRIGELMPNHETFSMVDYYSFVCDSWLRLNEEYKKEFGEQMSVPKFKYKLGQLTEHQIEYVKSHISYGTVEIS